MALIKATIYGAITKYNQSASDSDKLIRNLKRVCFGLRDRLLFMIGRTDFIDYRNYESKYSSNIGDIAISDAISELLIKKIPTVNLTYCNCGNISNKPSQISNGSNPIIVAGGGYFFIDRKGRLANRLISDLEHFKSTDAPLILFGVGLNQPEKYTFDFSVNAIHPDDVDLIRSILQRSQLISVRDETTKLFLNQFTNKEIYLIGDPAIYLSAENNTKSPIPTNNSNVVIGINIPFHGPASNINLKRNIFKYIYLLKQLQEISHCKFKYLIHYDTEHFIPRLLAIAGIKTEVTYGSASELIASYKQLNLHIGGMLHSCILAHNAGVPCIGLSYDIKHYNFFKLFELEENCYSALDFDPDKLLEKALYLLNNPATTRQTIATNKSLLRNKIDIFTDKCAQLLKSFPNN
jgi:polysaccharide pyruvyl transferase WcaK-like protein